MAEDVWTSFSREARRTCTFRHQRFAPLLLELGPSTRSSSAFGVFATRVRLINTFVKTASIKMRQQGSFPMVQTQSWECYGPHGKAGTTQPTFIHFPDTSLRVLLLLLDQHCRCRSSRDGYGCKRGLRPCCVWFQNELP